MRRFVQNIAFQYYVEARFVAENGGKGGEGVERRKKKVRNARTTATLFTRDEENPGGNFARE